MDPSFEEIVSRHYADIYRFALSLTGSEAEAADLTQHAFLRYAQHRERLRRTGAAKAWLLRTARNHFLDQVRRRSRYPHVNVDESPEGPTECSEWGPADRIDARSAVAALQRLDEKFRLPLALFYLEGLPYREIADLLDIPPGTVMSRLSRAKTQLRSLLESPPP